jgi:uncharacterized membrane protein YdjX (TVP38/TMEM64 family)
VTGARARSSLAPKLAAVAGVVLVLVVAQQLGVLEELADPARATRAFAALGPWGYVAFVVAYALLQPFGVPGTAFILAAPLIWPWPLAFALSMIGTMAASVVGFSFSRFVARDWVATRIPARFRKYDQALESRAFTTVFLLRLVFWMPPPLHAFFGVSKVSFAMHFWGSLAGYVLPLLLVSFFGQRLFDFMREASTGTWLAVAAATLLLLVVWVFRRRILPRPRPAPRQD